jgi:hypothetical protein
MKIRKSWVKDLATNFITKIQVIDTDIKKLLHENSEGLNMNVFSVRASVTNELAI